MSEQLHSAAPHYLPFYITAPGTTDVLMVAMGIFLVVVVLAVGNIYLRLHSLPERMAHKSQKLQFEIVAILCLIALFTHMHIFWIIGLLLAVIDIPDFGTPLRSIAGSVEKIAGDRPPPLESTSAAVADDPPIAESHEKKLQAEAGPAAWVETDASSRIESGKDRIRGSHA